MTEEIKPCPFCGEQPVTNNRAGGMLGQVYCKNEDCFGPRTTALGIEDSTRQWNKRLSDAHSQGCADNDPTASKEWNAGCDFALERLAKYVDVDMASIRWDGATETVEGDVDAVIGNILRAKFAEDWGPNGALAERESHSKLADKAGNFREGAKRLYESKGHHGGDMWFFELWHFLGDVQGALNSPAETRRLDDHMTRARRLVENHIEAYGMVPHPDRIKEAIAEQSQDSFDLGFRAAGGSCPSQPVSGWRTIDDEARSGEPVLCYWRGEAGGPRAIDVAVFSEGCWRDADDAAIRFGEPNLWKPLDWPPLTSTEENRG